MDLLKLTKVFINFFVVEGVFSLLIRLLVLNRLILIYEGSFINESLYLILGLSSSMLPCLIAITATLCLIKKTIGLREYLMMLCTGIVSFFTVVSMFNYLQD